MLDRRPETIATGNRRAGCGLQGRKETSCVPKAASRRSPTTATQAATPPSTCMAATSSSEIRLPPPRRPAAITRTRSVAVTRPAEKPRRQRAEISHAKRGFQLGQRTQRQAEDAPFAIDDRLHLAAPPVRPAKRLWFAARCHHKPPNVRTPADFQRDLEAHLAVIIAGIFERRDLEGAAHGAEGGDQHLPGQDRGSKKADRTIWSEAWSLNRPAPEIEARSARRHRPKSSRQRPALSHPSHPPPPH